MVNPRPLKFVQVIEIPDKDLLGRKGFILFCDFLVCGGETFCPPLQSIKLL